MDFWTWNLMYGNPNCISIKMRYLPHFKGICNQFYIFSIFHFESNNELENIMLLFIKLIGWVGFIYFCDYLTMFDVLIIAWVSILNHASFLLKSHKIHVDVKVITKSLNGFYFSEVWSFALRFLYFSLNLILKFEFSKIL